MPFRFADSADSAKKNYNKYNTTVTEAADTGTRNPRSADPATEERYKQAQERADELAYTQPNYEDNGAFTRDKIRAQKEAAMAARQREEAIERMDMAGYWDTDGNYRYNNYADIYKAYRGVMDQYDYAVNSGQQRQYMQDALYLMDVLNNDVKPVTREDFAAYSAFYDLDTNSSQGNSGTLIPGYAPFLADFELPDDLPQAGSGISLPGYDFSSLDFGTDYPLPTDELGALGDRLSDALGLGSGAGFGDPSSRLPDLDLDTGIFDAFEAAATKQALSDTAGQYSQITDLTKNEKDAIVNLIDGAGTMEELKSAYETATLYGSDAMTDIAATLYYFKSQELTGIVQALPGEESYGDLMDPRLSQAFGEYDGLVDLLNETEDYEKSYLDKTLNYLVLGNGTDDFTTLGLVGQGLLGTVGADLPMDIRDFTYDITHPDEVSWWDTVLDGVGLLPLVGDIKYLKYGDELAEAAQTLAKHGDDVIDVAGEAAEEVAKHADDVGEELEDAVANLGDYAGNITLSPYDLYPTHTRTMSNKEFAALLKDIQANGIQDSIKYVIYNGDRYVVDGHHRLLASKLLNLLNIPVEEVLLPYKGYSSFEDLFWG